jgi:hypothetical protein
MLVRVGCGGGLSSSISCRYANRLSSASHSALAGLYARAAGSNGGKGRRKKKSVASPGCRRSCHVVVVCIFIKGFGGLQAAGYSRSRKVSSSRYSKILSVVDTRGDSLPNRTKCCAMCYSVQNGPEIRCTFSTLHAFHVYGKPAYPNAEDELSASAQRRARQRRRAVGRAGKELN